MTGFLLNTQRPKIFYISCLIQEGAELLSRSEGEISKKIQMIKTQVVRELKPLPTGSANKQKKTWKHLDDFIFLADRNNAVAGEYEVTFIYYIFFKHIF